MAAVSQAHPSRIVRYTLILTAVQVLWAGAALLTTRGMRDSKFEIGTVQTLFINGTNKNPVQ